MRTAIRHQSVRLIAVALSAALIMSVAVPAYGVTNAAIRAKQHEAAAASTKEQALGDELESRGEELAQIEAKVDDTRKQIGDSEADLVVANQNLQHARWLLDLRATTIYRNGAGSAVSVLVGASDFSDFITRLDLMRRIGSSDAALVATVKEAKASVEELKRSLETRETEQMALRAAARAKEAEVQAALERQRSYLATIHADLKKLIVKEQQRQEAIARAKAAAEAAARSRAAGTSDNTPVGTLGSSHSSVVAIARQYLGVPYVWGGTTPAGFDCSGLVQYCYAKVGISLPRTSRMQFHYGSFIPAGRTDLLAAGDLVFFGTNGNANLVHHVALYIGGGLMIEAPYTGSVVRISSLFGRIASSHDYVGACRP